MAIFAGVVLFSSFHFEEEPVTSPQEQDAVKHEPVEPVQPEIYPPLLVWLWRLSSHGRVMGALSERRHQDLAMFYI